MRAYYYAHRNCPYPRPTKGDVIGYNRAAAEEWEIIAITMASDPLAMGLWDNNRSDDLMIYLDALSFNEYDMLMAFGVPTIDEEALDQHYEYVMPQMVTYKGNRKPSLHMRWDKS